jgi:hypothetical protein
VGMPHVLTAVHTYEGPPHQDICVEAQASGYELFERDAKVVRYLPVMILENLPWMSTGLSR